MIRNIWFGVCQIINFSQAKVGGKWKVLELLTQQWQVVSLVTLYHRKCFQEEAFLFFFQFFNPWDWLLDPNSHFLTSFNQINEYVQTCSMNSLLVYSKHVVCRFEVNKHAFQCTCTWTRTKIGTAYFQKQKNAMFKTEQHSFLKIDPF